MTSTEKNIERFINTLETMGGSAGNQRLQETLGWSEPTYNHIKQQLLAEGRIIPGRGRGGSVALPSTTYTANKEPVTSLEVREASAPYLKTKVKATLPTSIVTTASFSSPPQGYADWLTGLKERIHTAQQRATLAVNRELVLLYWQIGHDILARQAEQGWGAKVIERLAHDLRTAFPQMKGFSPRNLKYMRAFAEAWPDVEFVQEVLAQLPWYHQLALLDKLPGPQI